MAYNMRDDIKEVYFTEEQLQEKVAELGARITEDYRDKNPLIVSVLKGSYVFMADLTRAIDTKKHPQSCDCGCFAAIYRPSGVLTPKPSPSIS